jgi:hypothetical protein
MVLVHVRDEHRVDRAGFGQIEAEIAGSEQDAARDTEGLRFDYETDLCGPVQGSTQCLLLVRTSVSFDETIVEIIVFDVNALPSRKDLICRMCVLDYESAG